VFAIILNCHLRNRFNMINCNRESCLISEFRVWKQEYQEPGGRRSLRGSGGDNKAEPLAGSGGATLPSCIL
jgi:hypothetical protein